MRFVRLIRVVSMFTYFSLSKAFHSSLRAVPNCMLLRPSTAGQFCSFRTIDLFQTKDQWQEQCYQTKLFSSQIDQSEGFAVIDNPNDIEATAFESDNENSSWPSETDDEGGTICLGNDSIYSSLNVTDQSTAANSTVINGAADGLMITQLYHAPLEGFSIDQHVSSDHHKNQSSSVPQLFTLQDLQRLEITPSNVTLPTALMLLDPVNYPTQSRARKAIRKKSICYFRYSTSNNTISTQNTVNKRFFPGKVLTRIYPGDMIGVQRRKGDDYYASQGEVYRPPPFEIPVIYEDDHMAIINKPAGVVLYRAQGGRGGGEGRRGGGAKNRGHGRDTLLSALPHVLIPSNITDPRMIDQGHVPLKRPHPVHRLDRPTSGLVVVAKTKYAAMHLARQFEFRQARKTYMAIVNGYPTMSGNTVIKEGANKKDDWNIIDYDLENKSAVTEWRVVKSINSLIGNDGVLTLIEMKPKTGRYHQLRRHFAWVCNTPLVGDSTYDNGDTNALRLRQRGLFLCSNGIEIQHPYYNSPIGQVQWTDALESNVLCRDEESGCIMVKAKIDLPDKFASFLFHENRRAEKFS